MRESTELMVKCVSVVKPLFAATCQTSLRDLRAFSCARCMRWKTGICLFMKIRQVICYFISTGGERVLPEVEDTDFSEIK